jgi:hypothetical protein
MNKNTKIYLIRGCYGNWNKVYVGKTINEFSRKNDHRRKYGYDVEYEILEELEGTNRKIWKLRESYWIQYYIDLGFEVQNKQLKGGGGVEFHTEETKTKIKEWKKKNRIRLRKDVEDRKNEIIKLYREGIGPHNLSKKFNCHPDVIKRILKEGNIEFRTPSESQKCRKGEKRRKDLYDKLPQIKLLHSQGKTYEELGRMFNTSGVQIKKIINKT